MFYLRYNIPYTAKKLFIVFHKLNGYIEGYDRCKYLTLIPANKKIKVY